MRKKFFIAWAWFLVQVLEMYLRWVPLAECQVDEITSLIDQYHQKVSKA